MLSILWCVGQQFVHGRIVQIVLYMLCPINSVLQALRKYVKICCTNLLDIHRINVQLTFE